MGMKCGSTRSLEWRAQRFAMKCERTLGFRIQSILQSGKRSSFGHLEREAHTERPENGFSTRRIPI